MSFPVTAPQQIGILRGHRCLQDRSRGDVATTFFPGKMHLFHPSRLKSP